MDIRDFLQASKRTAPRDKGDLQRANYALGLAGESGEVVDLIKKIVFHGHENAKDKVKGELGDVAHYWVILCDMFDFDPAEVLQENIDKLKKRYPEGFSKERSINRET